MPNRPAASLDLDAIAPPGRRHTERRCIAAARRRSAAGKPVHSRAAGRSSLRAVRAGRTAAGRTAAGRTEAGRTEAERMRRRAGRIAVAAGRSFRRRVERMRRAVGRHSPAAAVRHLGRKTVVPAVRAVPAAEHCPNRTVVVDYQSCGSVPSQSGTAIPSYRFCTTSSHVLPNSKTCRATIGP